MKTRILTLLAIAACAATVQAGKITEYLYTHPTTPVSAAVSSIDPPPGAVVIDTSTGTHYRKISAVGSNATYAIVQPDYLIATAVAAAGSTVADAGVLGAGTYVQVSSDGATKGVKLPTGITGQIKWVINTTATACELYAATGGTVNGLSANASVVLPASKGVICICTAADTWVVFDLTAKATAS